MIKDIETIIIILILIAIFFRFTIIYFAKKRGNNSIYFEMCIGGMNIGIVVLIASLFI